MSRGSKLDKINLQSIFGALFFNVPGKGMKVEALAALAEELPARYNFALLDDRLGFRPRDRQHEAFCAAFDFQDSRIISFFASKRSPTVRVVCTSD